MSELSGWKTVIAHVCTVLVTLGLGAYFLGDRKPGAVDVAGRQFGPREKLVPDIQTTTPVPLPEEFLRQFDADERINIGVYINVNRSVVNITTAAETGGIFGVEPSGGGGSGFVIDKEGRILTNYHVVEGAEHVQVTLFDGSNQDAKIVGLDASNDVAVLQIEAPADKLVPIVWGDSSKVLVGQKILAIGNPFGLERTLTTGIVSSLDRSLKAKNGRMIKGVIQTDAAINPGNSGGPLLNSRGEVIGINTAIVSQVGQSAGISFAVPINAIQRILKSLIEKGRVIRADLGITRVYRTNGGLLVLGLTDGGAAARAGIKAIEYKVVSYGAFSRRVPDPKSADLIVAVDGKPVKSVDDLLTEVEAHPPGKQVKVHVLRGGEGLDIIVTLGES